ncbi:MAG TPA: DUF1800 domain-containing protein [Planktothrix sp.]|jgi:uncharacterized protein (DUF1800 family)
MKLSRRQILQATAVAASAIPLSGCEHIVSGVTGWMGETIPDTLEIPHDKKVDPIFHLLARAAYGAYPGEYDRAKQMGANAWIEEQLQPEKIDDHVCEFRAQRFETLQLDPGTCYEYKKPVLRDEIVRHTIVRAVYSKRQLYEVMVGFWTDHLNINIDKGDCIYLKPSDDRLVVRAHALGNFRDLIRASTTSPAMLVYLDGNENKKSSPTDIPNENYGRELLELHTLGVNGGYTQKDVYEVARCLTGWHLHTPWQRAKVYFDQDRHDDGEKNVLGHTIPAGGGEGDLDRVVDIVCAYPSTAHHIATKLAVRFVSDDPPPALVKSLATTFTRTKGDIKSVMRALLTSSEFQESRATKLRRPLHYIISCLRMTGADTYAHDSLLGYLGRMGQGPFQWPTPDGYPDKAQHWTASMLWRWNFALALASGSVPAAQVDLEKLATAIASGETYRRGGLQPPGFATAVASDEQQTHRRGGLQPPGRLQGAPASSVAARNSIIAEPRKSTATEYDDNFRLEKLFPYFVGRTPNKEELAAFAPYLKPIATDDVARKAELVGLILASPAFQRY